MNRFYLKILICIFPCSLLIVLILSGCSSREDTDGDIKVLARIGDKKITVNEFIKRSEYTIRPSYCRDNSPVHKKIVLNSLIGEKLLAIESGESNELAKNPDFQAYLEGRKEQAMRQVQFYDEFYRKVTLTQENIESEFKKAGRIYDISYFTIKDKRIADLIVDGVHVAVYHHSTGIPHTHIVHGESMIHAESVRIKKSQNNVAIGSYPNLRE